MLVVSSALSCCRSSALCLAVRCCGRCARARFDVNRPAMSERVCMWHVRNATVTYTLSGLWRWWTSSSAYRAALQQYVQLVARVRCYQKDRTERENVRFLCVPGLDALIAPLLVTALRPEPENSVCYWRGYGSANGLSLSLHLFGDPAGL